MKEDQAFLVSLSRIVKSEADVSVNFNHIKFLIIKLSLDRPLFGIVLSPYLNFWAINNYDLSVVDGWQNDSMVHLFTRIVDHYIHFEALKAILNDISWPEFKGLNLDIFVWIHVSEWLKSNQVFTVRSKGKAFHLSFWRNGPLIHGWDKVSCFNLKFLDISIINSKWLKIIIMSNYQVTIIKLSLNIRDWLSV